MKRYLAALAAASIVLSSASAWSAEWTRQPLAGTNVSLEAPAVLVAEPPAPLDGGFTALKWSGTVMESRTGYLFTAMDFSKVPGLAEVPHPERVQAMVGGIARTWSVVTNRPYAVEGGAGAELTGRGERGGFSRTRVISRGSWIYSISVVVIGDESRLTSPDVERFLDSLTLPRD